ncbi:subtilisin-like [Musa troglodytarum]|uniref:Subtilisin-like n=1 Tax=Musa troglodytarum TaxID=320322 RepID=A0A9E7JCR4_9LILI|nr:subtilisin-like [Musa troglodytarum]
MSMDDCRSNDFSISGPTTELKTGRPAPAPKSAMDPGLVYDLKPADYLDLLCSMGYNSTQLAHFTDPPYACPKQKIEEHNLNYPMIAIRYPMTTATAMRTMKNVGPPGTYKASLKGG